MPLAKSSPVWSPWNWTGRWPCVSFVLLLSGLLTWVSISRALGDCENLRLNGVELGGVRVHSDHNKEHRRYGVGCEWWKSSNRLECLASSFRKKQHRHESVCCFQRFHFHVITVKNTAGKTERPTFGQTMTHCFYWLNLIWNQIWTRWLSWSRTHVNVDPFETTREVWLEIIPGDGLTESNFFPCIWTSFIHKIAALMI